MVRVIHPTNRLPSSAPFSEPCEHLFGQQESLQLSPRAREVISHEPASGVVGVRTQHSTSSVAGLYRPSRPRAMAAMDTNNLQRGRTCAREQTQDTTTSMGSRAMVAEHAPHHTLVFHGVGARSRARWTARPLSALAGTASFLDDLTPWISRETCRSSCQERAIVPDAWLGGMTRSQLVRRPLACRPVRDLRSTRRSPRFVLVSCMFS